MLSVKRMPMFVRRSLPAIVIDDIAVKLIELGLAPTGDSIAQVMDRAVDELDTCAENVRAVRAGDAGWKTRIVTAQPCLSRGTEKFDVLKGDVIAEARISRVADGDGWPSTCVKTISRTPVRTAINSGQLTGERLKSNLTSRIA